jgi:hypothetical protein
LRRFEPNWHETRIPVTRRGPTAPIKENWEASMRFLIRSRTALFLAGLLATSALAAQPAAKDDIPLRNWTVPAYQAAGGELGKLVDISPGVAFVAVTPCRMVDTRNAPGPYGGPKFTAGEGRNFDLNNHPTCTGIPAGVDAYSLNFTVTGTDGAGFLAAYPTGSPFPGVSTLNYTGVNDQIANAAIVPAGTGGSIHVDAGVSGTHVIIDINGYFTDEYNNGVGFRAIGNAASGQMGLFQNITVAANSWGVVGLYGGSLTGTLSAGVKGVSGVEPTVVSSEPSAGVLGLSANENGVYGISTLGTGVVGHIHSAMGADLGSGRLGFWNGGTPFAIYSNGNAHVQGNFTASGTKMFVQPHPTDAGKEIRYIAVESPSPEIYFRGTAQVQQGISRIDVPEHFRLVARRGTYSTLVTPVGDMATVAVVSENENGIVIKASRNVKVHYVVYAERDGFDAAPIAENIHFRPDANGEMGVGLTDYQRQILVQNGTLNPDGTVNLETAERLGWKIEGRRAHPPGK